MVVSAGLWMVWTGNHQPEEPAEAISWPEPAGLERDPSRPTLVLMAHPHCTCTKDSLAELADVLTRARTRPKTYVVFLRPAPLSAGWEQSYLWGLAKTLPDVTVLTDRDGAIAERFGAATSGETFLYDAGGILLFTGGIAGSRAHPGDGDASDAVLELLAGADAATQGINRLFGASRVAPRTEASSRQ
jgi:hypothetical protein